MLRGINRSISVAAFLLPFLNDPSAVAAPPIPGAVLSIGYGSSDLNHMRGIRQYGKSGMMLDVVPFVNQNVSPAAITVIGNDVWISEISDAGACIGTVDMTTGVFARAFSPSTPGGKPIHPQGLANFGGDLLTVSEGGMVIRYTDSGRPAILFTAPGTYSGIDTDGSRIFLANVTTGSVDTYTPGGVLVSSTRKGLVNGYSKIAYDPRDSTFFVWHKSKPGSVTHFSQAGTPIGFFSVPENTNVGLEIVAVPEGSAFAFALSALGMIGIAMIKRRRR